MGEKNLKWYRRGENFPINSPFIEELTVHKRGRVRRAKLYHSRGRQGKSARIRERIRY